MKVYLGAWPTKFPPTNLISKNASQGYLIQARAFVTANFPFMAITHGRAPIIGEKCQEVPHLIWAKVQEAAQRKLGAPAMLRDNNSHTKVL